MWSVKWCLVLLPGLAALGEDPCTMKSSCKECISTPSCHWCIAPAKGEQHCVRQSEATVGWCTKENEVKYENDYNVMTEEAGHHQIRPQKAQLKLRLGEQFQVPVKFVKAVDYPVDLYYLMDLSHSMADDKDKLSALGGQLTTAMKKLTRNFRLGFGSFVDKRAMPFVSTVPSKLEAPCTLKTGGKCAPPYSFKNHMPLDNDTDKFSVEVDKAPVSGNLDSPEGGFDALMQAMVCTEQIKWRADARRLLVFSTDASFHLAGDGRLAGIIEPNDGLCYMNEHGEHTHALEYDYPSISQLNEKARENDINIIFAVEKNQEAVYKQLAERIYGSSFGTLSQNSDNVVKLVGDQYEKLVASVTMTVNAHKDVEVRFTSNCLNPMEDWKNTDKCGGLRFNQTVTFNATIKVMKCPESTNGSVWKHTLQFKPQGINETLEVELEVYCGCPCEQEGNKGYEKNSSSCSYNGTYECGICKCRMDRTGRNCECAESGLKTDTDNERCRTGNSTICNGRGTCKCGVCICFKRHNKEEKYSGTFCQCDNFSCNRHEGRLCNGPDKGTCKCGVCECQPGWTGAACQSIDNPKECIDPSTDKECSDHGRCEDGKCVCDNQKYTGKYCQDCVLCPGGRCRELGDCVECLVYETGRLAEDCNDQCNLTITQVVDKLTEEDEVGSRAFCQLPDDSRCTFVFLYEDINGEVNITAQREKECPVVVNVLAVVFGVIGSTVIIGLLIILIWKLLTSIHDRREYAKFEKERATAKFDSGDNPLYKGAVTKFDNPTFSRN